MPMHLYDYYIELVNELHNYNELKIEEVNTDLINIRFKCYPTYLATLEYDEQYDTYIRFLLVDITDGIETRTGGWDKTLIEISIDEKIGILIIDFIKLIEDIIYGLTASGRNKYASN